MPIVVSRLPAKIVKNNKKQVIKLQLSSFTLKNISQINAFPCHILNKKNASVVLTE